MRGVCKSNLTAYKPLWLVLPLVFGLWILGFYFVPPVYKLKSGSVEVQRWDRFGGHIQVQVGVKERDWVPFHRFSRFALGAIVVAEDARFYEHFGLDLTEIWESFKINYKSERIVRGASTITQQVVKMAFLDNERVWTRKIREALGAVLLEVILSKDEILTWYVNLCDFGSGIYGMKQAARYYFNTKPEMLTVNQSVHLALVIPSPNKWSIGLRKGHLTEFGHKRFRKIVWELRANGFISDEQLFQAMATGDFGSPVRGSIKIKQKVDRDSAFLESAF